MPSTITLDVGGNLSAFERDVAASVGRVQAKLKSRPFEVSLKDNVSLPLGRMTGRAEDFDKSLTAATNRVVAFGAAAGAFTLVKRSFDALVDSTVEVEQALARINVNLGQSKSSLSEFSKQIFDIARNTGQTFETTAKAAEELARQGLSAQETLKRLKDASILARVAGIDTAEAVEKLTAAVNSFSKEGLTTSEIINKLAAVDTKFAVSSKDLGDAISRVGLAASEAGVDFNHLVAIVTAVQQTTQRGGAIISTALNSIFAKIQKPEVLHQLEGIGVAVKDVKGNVLPALDILKNLGDVFDNLSQSQQSLITNQIADTRHINILKTTLGELTKGYGAYQSALKTASGATNEAIAKNDQLNKTLATQLNDTQLSIKQFLSSLGNAGTGDLFKTLITGFNSVLHEVSGANAEKAGNDVGSSILKGISNVLTGPAFIGIAFVLGKTFAAVGQSAVKSLSAIIGITSEAKARAVIQGQINGLLEQATTAEKAQYNAATAVEQKKRIILGIDQRITAELEKQALVARALEGEFLGTASVLSKTLSSVGAGGFLSPARRTTLQAGRGFASGYLPVQKEMQDIQRGVGGAPANAKPVILNNVNLGGGVGTAVANTSEYLVPHFAGGSAAIFNQNMVRSMGLPKGAKSLGSFAGGVAKSALDVAMGVGGGEGAGGLTSSYAAALKRSQEKEVAASAAMVKALDNSAKALAESVRPINELVTQTKIAADKTKSFSRKVFYNGTNVFGEKATKPNIPYPFEINESGVRGDPDPSSFVKPATARPKKVRPDRSVAILKEEAGLFGNFEKTFERLVKEGALRNNPVLRGQASQLQSRRESRRQGASFAAAIALPIAAGFVDEGQGGTAGGIGRGALSGALNGGGTGAIFGPVGAGIGAVVGGLIGIFGKLTQSTVELAKQFDEANGQQRKELTAENELINAYNERDQAIKSGATSDVLGRLNSRVSSARLGVQDRTALAEIDSGTPQQRAARLDRTGAAADVAEKLRSATLAIKGSSFGGPNDIRDLSSQLAAGLAGTNTSGIDLKALKGITGTARGDAFGAGADEDVIDAVKFVQNVDTLKDVTKKLGISFDSLSVGSTDIGKKAAVVYQAILRLQKNTQEAAKLTSTPQDRNFLRGSFLGTNFDQGESSIASLGGFSRAQGGRFFNPLGQQRNRLDAVARLAQLGGVDIDEHTGTLTGKGGIDVSGLQKDFTRDRSSVGLAGAQLAAQQFLGGQRGFERTNFTNRDGTFNSASLQQGLTQFLAGSGGRGGDANYGKTLKSLLEAKVAESLVDVGPSNNGVSAYAGTNKGLIKGVLYGKEADEAFGFRKQKAQDYFASHERPTTQFDVNAEGFNVVKQVAKQMETTVATLNSTKLTAENTIKVDITLSPEALGAVSKDNLDTVTAAISKKLGELNDELANIRGKPNPPSSTRTIRSTSDL